MIRTHATLSVLLFSVAVAGCSSEVDQPSPNPPPSWGVPITGGTMLVTRDGKHAVVADPDRDRIVSIDLANDAVIAELALLPGDEPGRLVEDGAGRIHVALRRGASLLTLADASAAAPVRRPACAEPRGLAWDATTDVVHVACAGGELVTFPAAGGDATRRIRVDRDLRDVIVAGDKLVITRFRSAELVTLDATGTVLARALPPTVKRFSFGGFGGGGAAPDISGNGEGLVDAIPAIAWRATALADGRIVTLHQRQIKAKLQTTTGGYGQGCGGGPVETSVTVMRPGEAPIAVTSLVNGTLPVDLAISPLGERMAIATAGTGAVHIVRTSSLTLPDENDGGGCGGGHDEVQPIQDGLGAPTSVAYTPAGALVIFYPERPALAVHHNGGTRIITLPGDLGYDSGRTMFHQQTASGLSCASCHPEGRDDGLVWEFADIGIRRTQTLAGGILRRAPYHWAGDMTDLTVLMEDVFAERMLGGEVTRSQKLSLGPWLDRIPAPAPSPTADVATIDRGRALFESVEQACTTCHSGELLTNNRLFDVGTGGPMKVPSLVGVAARAPFMHTGCATTLADRFGACGGGDLHGKTSTLPPSDIAALVAYLETL